MPYDCGVSGAHGTPEFMAPELLTSASSDGAKGDLWSLGCMLYEALAGKVPFTGTTLPAILRAALKGEPAPLPPGVGNDCRTLVAALLQPDPARRISLEAALEQPWLRGGMQRRLSLASEPSELPAGELPGEAAGGAAAGEGDDAAAGAPFDGPAAAAAGGRPSCGMRRSASFDQLPRAGSLTLQLPADQLSSAEPLPTVAEEASLRCLSRAVSRRAASSPAASPAGKPVARSLSSRSGSGRTAGASPKL